MKKKFKKEIAGYDVSEANIRGMVLKKMEKEKENCPKNLYRAPSVGWCAEHQCSYCRRLSRMRDELFSEGLI